MRLGARQRLLRCLRLPLMIYQSGSAFDPGAIERVVAKTAIQAAGDTMHSVAVVPGDSTILALRALRLNLQGMRWNRSEVDAAVGRAVIVVP